MNAQLLRQRYDVLATLQSLDRHSTKLVRIPSLSFPRHFAVPFPAKCAIPACLKIAWCHPFGLVSRVRNSVRQLRARPSEKLKSDPQRGSAAKADNPMEQTCPIK